MIRALIVDDERLARERVRALLSEEEDIEIVGEASDGRRAAAAIRDARPDVVFLDIEMPERDGFEALAAVPPGREPVVVFVTAHEQHALRAFEEDAADYLLKPFDRARFRETLERVRSRLDARENGDLGRRLRRLVENWPAPPGAGRLAVRSGGKTILVDLARVDWIEGSANYVRIHMGTEVVTHRVTISELADQLEARGFLRVHRSTIVNIARIREIEAGFAGAQVLTLHDGTRLMMSRNYRSRLARIVGVTA
jgi:two-component system LytT family response regulator